MKGFAVGLLLGLVLSVGGSVGAQVSPFYFDVKAMVNGQAAQSEHFRNGYVAGTADALTWVNTHIENSPRSPEQKHAWLKEIAKCLSMRGKTVRTLRLYADAMWQDANENMGETLNAASVVLTDACEP